VHALAHRLVLDMTARNLERVIYYEDYMVIDPGNTPLKPHQLLSEHEYREARETYGADAFVAKMGAEAVREALAKWTWPSRSNNCIVR
jgi:DNA-directed RNA polymerase subunit beta'